MFVAFGDAFNDRLSGVWAGDNLRHGAVGEANYKVSGTRYIYLPHFAPLHALACGTSLLVSMQREMNDVVCRATFARLSYRTDKPLFPTRGTQTRKH